MITDDELRELELLVRADAVEKSRDSLFDFTKLTFNKFIETDFHRTYYQILDLWAKGIITKLIVTMPPQHGKAIKADTPVLTLKGWVNHSDLKAGDYVFGEDGNPVKVLENHGIHEIESSIVNFSGDEQIIASNNHEWVVYCDREKYKVRNGKSKTNRVREILETNDLLIGQRRSPAIKANIPININAKKILPIDPYTLGAWLGDGNSNQGVLIVGSEDIDHFSKLGEAREVKTGIYRVLITGLSKSLRIAGIIKNKHIPVDYLLASYNDRLELLRGLMDTDGCVGKKGECEFAQKDNGLAEDVFVLMRSLGLKPRIHKYDMKIYGRIVGKKIRVSLSKPNERIFNLERKSKLQLYSQRIDGTRYFIESIIPIGKQEVNCITVEGGVYLVGKQLIITHNSEGSTRRLPAYCFGINPDERIAIASYNTTFSQKFNRDIQRIIVTPEYAEIFPDTTLNVKNVITVASNYLRNSNEFEIVNHLGSLKSVGRGGGITGNPIDKIIMDDLYKDSAEGNSPTIRDAVWEWYTGAITTRLHNNSQQLIVFTRWHEDDLIGRIEKSEKVITAKTWEDIYSAGKDTWVKINYQAIMEEHATELDNRKKGEPLFPQRHSKKKLLKDRATDTVKFECLYQGNPTSAAGLLYGQNWMTYKTIPDTIVRKNYTDTADTGTDYLCSITYDVGVDGLIYVVDVIYTDDPMEVTEPLVANSILKHDVKYSDIESNNGGRGFARKIQELTEKRCTVKWFTQTNNKESRIITEAATVMQMIVFPENWSIKWARFYLDIIRFKRNFKANKHDDGADVLTGIIEVQNKKQYNFAIN